MGRFQATNELELPEVIQKVLDIKESDYVGIPELTTELVEIIVDNNTMSSVEITNEIIDSIYQSTDLDTSELDIYQEAINSTSEDAAEEYQDQIDELTKEKSELEEEVAQLKAKIKELTNE